MQDSREYKKMTAAEALKSLKSSSDGLSDPEAARRLGEYGRNEITEKKKNYYLMFIKKFYGPVQLLLWLVVVLSYILNHMRDFYIVIALLLLNAIVGFVEEYRADKSIEALKGRLAQKARVLRDGKWAELRAASLVPGDIIRVRMGDIVPADTKILESQGMETDESSITGESLPVSKAVGDVAYDGSIVKRGEATCLVINTGYSTLYGKTARLVEKAKPKSHLEATIMEIVKYLVAGDAVVLVVMFVYGYYIVHETLATMLPFLLVMFIASVPVALSAAFTVSMALGTEKLARKSILTTRLEAIEDTSNMNVLCMDKTGTITKNKITVKDIFATGCSRDELLKYAAEASREDDKDQIDMSIISYVRPMKIRLGTQAKFSPFDSSTKRTEATVKDGRSSYEVTKGAAHVVTELCKLKGKDRQRADKKIMDFAGQGYRTIAVAKKQGGPQWKFMGFIALYDEPRGDAHELILELHDLGISTKMITGDNIAVAKQIAGEVGMGTNIVDAKVLRGKKIGEIQRDILDANGFSDVYPEDKYTIVKALQAKGLIVGMTGDGVNDAPALKQAEVGIAVSNATDVAKDAAALELTRNGIEVIVNAVKESRRIFERMATYAMVKIVKVFQIIGFIAIAFIAFRIIPIVPFLLILLIFTNDIVNISISTDNAMYSKKPDVWKIRALVTTSAVMGAMLIVPALALIPIELGMLGLTVAQLQASAFLIFDITDQFTIMNVRSKSWFWKSRPSNFLLGASAFGILVGLIFTSNGIFMARLGLLPILIVVALSVLFFLINDVLKIALFKHFDIK